MIGRDTLLSCGLNFKVENAYTLKCGNIYGHENLRFRDGNMNTKLRNLCNKLIGNKDGAVRTRSSEILIEMQCLRDSFPVISRTQ